MVATAHLDNDHDFAKLAVAQKVFDTADIVRDAIFRQVAEACGSNYRAEEQN
jgi:hypothetical protein